MKKSKMGIGGTIVMVILFVIVVVGIYLMITRTKNEGKLESNVDITEYSTLKQRNLITNYPQTAREVVKLYCRITKCLYNEELSDSQIEELVDMLRMLYSSELLDENPREDMIGLVKGDIQSYKKFERTINSYSIDDSGDIVYVRTTKPAKATVNMYFTIKAGSAFERAYEEILLVEENENIWKILGWRQSEDTSLKKQE